MSEISTENVKIVEQQDISNECNENNINPEGEDAQGEDDLSDVEKVENVKNIKKSPQTNEEMIETVESQCSVLIKQNSQMILEKQAAEIETQEKTTPQKKCEAEDVPENNCNRNHNEVTETKSSCELKDNSIESSVVPETLFVKENSATNLNHEDISSRENKLQEKNTPSQVQYSDHVTYTQDGTAIYTDPETNYQYKWCTKENNWISNDAIISTNPYENEHYKWCNETQKWIPKQSQVTETEHYKWDAEKNQWIAKVKLTNVSKQTNPADIVYDIDKDGQRTYTDQDGAVFFWDVEKNAWFPKIDDDFMARYQMSYGFIDNTSESEKEKEKLALAAAEQKQEELAKMVEEAKANTEASNETNKQGLKRKGQQEPPKWFEIDPAHNTKVYVSNLPLDITLDEFADVMGKCGMIMRDPQTQKYKLKLYTEDDGQIKGDGLCDYIKVESVDLALKILDEYDLRGHKIRVQRAQFQMRGEYNPALKPKRKKKDKEKLAKIKEKLFDWRPEKMRGERSKHEKTVIIKNLFNPNIFEKEVQLILDYQNDLREECSKCGTVRKVVIYDRHSEGVAQVNMSSPEEADLVIQMMHGRFFGKRQLTAEHWDGKTKYKVEETEEEIQKRLNKWDQYLETEENKKSELQQNENDIEKTINFEPVKKSKELQSSMGIQSVNEMSSVEHPETSESFQLSEKV